MMGDICSPPFASHLHLWPCLALTPIFHFWLPLMTSWSWWPVWCVGQNPASVGNFWIHGHFVLCSHELSLCQGQVAHLSRFGKVYNFLLLMILPCFRTLMVILLFWLTLNFTMYLFLPLMHLLTWGLLSQMAQMARTLVPQPFPAMVLTQLSQPLMSLGLGVRGIFRYRQPLKVGHELNCGGSAQLRAISSKLSAGSTLSISE